MKAGLLRGLACGGLFALSFAASADDGASTLAPPLNAWVEIPVPPEASHEDRLVWEYAGNYSPVSWRVDQRDDAIVAIRLSRSSPAADRPSFLPSPGQYDDGVIVQRVDDGWLVAFNNGEFGAVLYWYSVDGATRYPVSSDHVVAFFEWKDRWHAIEGLAHLGSSRGTVVALDKPLDRWQATTLMHLPGAPLTVSVTERDDLLIALHDALVRVDATSGLHMVLPKAPWRFFHPRSSAWDERAGVLYIGMRQYVARYEPATSTLTMLAPSPSAIHHLTPDEERRIRHQARQTTDE